MDEKPETAGVNKVDVSDARIEREIQAAIEDEDLKPVGSEENPESNSESPDNNTDTEGATGRLAGLLTMGFALVFGYGAPAWKIASEQCGELGAVWARLVVKYMPLAWLRYIPGVNGAGEGGACVECDALLITVQTVGPHINQPRHESEQPGEAQEVYPVTQPEPQTDAMPDIHQMRANDAP